MAALLVLVGCKSTRETQGTGVSRGKDRDPLVYGPTKIPKQDLPLPDRATGPRGRPDPLTSPAGGKAGYTDDPERFKGTFIPGKTSTPASLAGRTKDDEGLRIDSPGVPLVPAGGVVPGGALEAPEGVSPLYAQLDKYGVKPEDRSLDREDGKYVFRASVQITASGARRQYTGISTSAPEAVKQVVDQLAAEPK
ncbi:MAG: hypothetical protein J0I06_23405 [Planctomycetes bacterium]|nr:hypothetical protein [Planctomycetota bacterium]